MAEKMAVLTELKIYLTEEQRAALKQLAQREFRPVPDQAVLAIHKMLVAEGLVTGPPVMVSDDG